MKKIFIYFAPGEYDPCVGDGTTEFSNNPNGSVYATLTSPNIDEIWNLYQQEIKSSDIGDSARTFFASLRFILNKYEMLPFVLHYKANGSTWVREERCLAQSYNE